MSKATMKLVLVGIFAGFVILPLSGCGEKKVQVAPSEETARVEDTASAPAPAPENTSEPAVVVKPRETTKTAKVVAPVKEEGAGASEPLDTPPPSKDVAPAAARADLALLPLYFDFDKSVVRPDQVAKIEGNALLLKSNPEVKVRIEGNCDERGTNEYNMALGERRATSALKYLVNLGVTEDRLTTLSYGEEKPVNPGHNEAAWAENRRGDFVTAQ